MILVGKRLVLDTRGIVMTAPAHHEVVEAIGGSTEEFQTAMQEILARHVDGDWGEIDVHDIGVNEDALKTGARVLSAYTVAGVKLWAISDAAHDGEHPDFRQVTTILLPSDY